MSRRTWWAIMFFAGATLAVAVWGVATYGPWRPPVALPGVRVIRPPHEVYAMAVDGETIWVGGRDGVFAIDRKSGSLRGELRGDVPLRYVKALLVDAGGTLWIGHTSGLTRVKGGEARTFTTADGLPDNRVNCLLQGRNGEIWAGTWRGAVAMGGDEWRILGTRDGLPDSMVNALFESSDGALWAGSFVAPRGGLAVLRSGTATLFTVAEGLPHNGITSIMEDVNGSVWAGTGAMSRGGLCRFEREGEKWALREVFRQGDGLAGAKVRSIFQDRSGLYWLGSEYDGMTLWDRRRWGYLRESDGLSAQETKVMIQDADGGLWMGTSDGVTWIASAQVGALRETCLARGSWKRRPRGAP